MITGEKEYSCRGRTGYYFLIKDYKDKHFFLFQITCTDALCIPRLGMCTEKVNRVVLYYKLSTYVVYDAIWPVASYGTVFFGLVFLLLHFWLHVLFTLSSALKFLPWIVHGLRDSNRFCIDIAVEFYTLSPSHTLDIVKYVLLLL